MSVRTSITLMSPDPSVAAAVSSALENNGHVLGGPTVQDLRDLSAQLGRSPVPIVLIDIDPEPQQILPLLERIVARFPTTRFVALASNVGSDLLQEAMQTGVRRVVGKQTMGAELPGILDRLTATDANATPMGSVLTLLSASGGCGATTIAVNLAEELALKQKQPTLICDFDCAYGAVSSYLGISPHYGADHILHYPGNIDGQLIRSTATMHNDRIHVLASPCSTNMDAAEPLRFDRLEHAMDSARRAYAITIVDAPRLRMETAAALAAGSAQTLLVLQLTVKDLRSARAMLDSLRGHGVKMDTVIPVANRFAKRQLIGLDEAAKALGGVNLQIIRNDYTPAIQGLNFGQTLSEASPRSTLRKDIQDLASKLELTESSTRKF
jgi:pilus assembly protein CpaE